MLLMIVSKLINSHTTYSYYKDKALKSLVFMFIDAWLLPKKMNDRVTQRFTGSVYHS